MLAEKDMTTSFQTCYTSDSIKCALNIFDKYKLNIIPVVNLNNELIGILTKNKVIHALNHDYPLSSPIESLVNFKPVYIHPESKVFETREKLLEHMVGHAPVVDSEKKVLGIISTAEILFSYSNLVDMFQSQLKLLFDSLQFGLLSVDTKLNITAINPLAKDFLQLTEECNASKKVLVKHKTIKDMIQHLFTNNEKPPKQKIKLNGYSFLIDCNPLFKNNKLIGAMVIMDDLTKVDELVSELEITKQWEEKLRILVESAYDAMLLVDENGLITMANKGFCDLFSTTEDKLLGKSILKDFPDLAIKEVLETMAPLNGITKTINSKQCLITNFPIINDGELAGVVSKITFRGLKQLHDALNKVSKLESSLTYKPETKYCISDIVGSSAAITKVKREAYAASKSKSTVLLIGDSGTGKELFAHGIHDASLLPGSFIKVNCSAIPKDLMESEFFGYAEGAFTGAKRGGKKGKFELAQNGTLFLDEIGDLPLDLQPKLLRVLQEKEFEPVGGSKTIKSDVRIIAATNKNLEEMIKNGDFREDLYYRLNILRITIPSLRERKEDIPEIVDNIIERLNRSGFYIKGITAEGLHVLKNYNWPGNIRELQNVLERAANLNDDGLIDIPELPDYIFEHQNNDMNFNAEESSTEHKSIHNPMDYKKNVMKTEKQIIKEALEEANGNKTKASVLLGISRTWLYSKIKQYDIDA